MIIFEIPETKKNKRDKLRYRLKKHSFGMIQSSIWISPREIPDSLNQFIEKENLSSMIQTLKFSVSKEDNCELISRAWQINKLNQAYREYVEEAKERFNLVKDYNWNSREIKNRVLKMLAEEFKDRYHNLAKNDPKLPKSVLPNNWQGFRAHHIYEQLFKYL
jgi:phenylacetic acid degradation operon negative regulatory protein